MRKMNCFREGQCYRDYTDNSMSLYEFCEKWDIDLRGILELEEYEEEIE